MTIPKKHHFVPRWYLQGFAKDADAALHIFDQQTGQLRKQKAKTIMCIRNYYYQKWAPPGKDPYILERQLGKKLESAAKLAITKMISDPVTITAQDTAVMALYLEFQRIRVPKHAAFAKSSFMQFAAYWVPELLQELVDGRISLTDGFRFDSMKMMIGAFTPFFRSMGWTLIKACPGSSFVTSDNPVSFFNVARHPPDEVYPNCLGTSVFFPIDRENFLVMTHPEYRSREASDPLEIVSGGGNQENGIALYRGKIFNDKEVTRHNWVMLKFAHRFLVGDSQETIERAIAYGP